MNLHRARVLAVSTVSGLAVAGVAWACGIALGFRGFAFAWVSHFLMMAWISGVLDAVQPRLDAAWFRVRPWEPRIYRRLGVVAYRKALRRVGWDRLGGRHPFDGTRASLAALERRTRMSEVGHLVVGAVGTSMVLVAVTLQAWDAAAWLLAVNVVLHAYPVMLQRFTRSRVGRLVGDDS